MPCACLSDNCWLLVLMLASEASQNTCSPIPVIGAESWHTGAPEGTGEQRHEAQPEVPVKGLQPRRALDLHRPQRPQHDARVLAGHLTVRAQGLPFVSRGDRIQLVSSAQRSSMQPIHVRSQFVC